MQFAQPVIHPDMRMLILAAIRSEMIVAMIRECLSHAIDGLVVGQNGPSLAARDRFDVIE